MTVCELIKVLLTMPIDAEVRVPDEGGYPDEVRQVQLNPYKDLFKHDFVVIS